jgi:cytoskeletal protein CcmA (bactofilin family)
MPTIVFLFVYLSQLLRIGEEEAAEEMLATVVDGEGDGDVEPVVIPRGARVGDDAWRVSKPARIGDGCRLHGNVRAASLVVGRDTEVFGSLRARQGVTVGARTEVTGNVTTRDGTVRIGPDAEIRGDVSGGSVELHHDAEIEGAIRASEETTIVSERVLDDTLVESIPSDPGDRAVPRGDDTGGSGETGGADRAVEDTDAGGTDTAAEDTESGNADGAVEDTTNGADTGDGTGSGAGTVGGSTGAAEPGTE